jgi:hypothetical protein
MCTAYQYPIQEIVQGYLYPGLELRWKYLPGQDEVRIGYPGVFDEPSHNCGVLLFESRHALFLILQSKDIVYVPNPSTEAIQEPGGLAQPDRFGALPVISTLFHWPG